MVVISIVLAVALAIIVGYATRQREELREAHERVENLLIENQELQSEVLAHLSTIEMVLNEVERLS